MMNNPLLINAVIEASILESKIAEQIARIGKPALETSLQIIELVGAMEARLENQYIHIGRLAVAEHRTEQKELYTVVQAVKVTYKPSGASVTRQIGSDSYYAARDTALMELLKREFGDKQVTIPFGDFETTWLYDWVDPKGGVNTPGNTVGGVG